MPGQLDPLVEKLKQALGGDLVSVVLYGSAAVGDYHEKFSDFNVLCVLKQITPAELGATATIDTTGQELADVAAAVVKLTGRGADVALDTTGNPGIILAAVQSLATHGTASVITSSGAPVTLPPGDLLLKGRQLRGTMGGHINPTIFIPRLLDLHARGRFPVDRLVKNYPFAELNTAIADSLSGATIKPVLTFE